LLYRVNQVYKELKKKHHLVAAGEVQEENAPQLENLAQVQQIASSIFKQVCFHINRNVKQLDIQSLQSALNTISQGSDLDKSELSKEALEEMEKKVIDNLPRYMNLDLATIIGSFLKLHYIPRSILHELNQLQALSTFNKYACLIILENLVQENYDESVEFYDKLFIQLQKNSSNMNTKLVSRTLSILLKYKQIFKNDKERGDQINDLTQFYVDRFNDSVKMADKQVETDVVLTSLENVRSLQKMQKETLGKDFDTVIFIENCLRLLEDRIDKLPPYTILRSFDSFEDRKLRQKYVGTILKAMRDNKLDIRRFNFIQLSELITLVAQYQKEDLHVFFKYVLSCFEQDYYSKLTIQQNFGSYYQMFHLFVKEGFIAP